MTVDRRTVRLLLPPTSDVNPRPLPEFNRRPLRPLRARRHGPSPRTRAGTRDRESVPGRGPGLRRSACARLRTIRQSVPRRPSAPGVAGFRFHGPTSVRPGRYEGARQTRTDQADFGTAHAAGQGRGLPPPRPRRLRRSGAREPVQPLLRRALRGAVGPQPFVDASAHQAFPERAASGAPGRDCTFRPVCRMMIPSRGFTATGWTRRE